MKNLIILTAVFLMLAVPVIAQENELGDPGITPDSPWYFLDRFGDAFQSAESLANEKAAESLAMAEQANSEALTKATQAYQKAMERRQEQAEGDEDVAEEVARQASKHLEVLATVREQVPSQALQGIDTALEVSAKGREESLNALRQQNSVRGEEVARETIEGIMENNSAEALEGLNTALQNIGSQDLNRVREERNMRGGNTTSGSSPQQIQNSETEQPTGFLPY